MTTRPLHPDDARSILETWRRESEAAHEEIEEINGELPEIIQKCLDAGLKRGEIAGAAGLSRTTIHRYMKKEAVTG